MVRPWFESVLLENTRLDNEWRIYFLRGLEVRTVKIKAVLGAGFLSATEMALRCVLRKGETLNACVARDGCVDEQGAMTNKNPFKALKP